MHIKSSPKDLCLILSSLTQSYGNHKLHLNLNLIDFYCCIYFSNKRVGCKKSDSSSQ